MLTVPLPRALARAALFTAAGTPSWGAGIAGEGEPKVGEQGVDVVTAAGHHRDADGALLDAQLVDGDVGGLTHRHGHRIVLAEGPGLGVHRPGAGRDVGEGEGAL